MNPMLDGMELWLQRWPVELSIAVTLCLGAAWVAVACCGRRSAALRAQLWLLGFGAAVVWTAVRMFGATVAVPILPAVPVAGVPALALPVHSREAARSEELRPVHTGEMRALRAPRDEAPAPLPSPASPRVPWSHWVVGVWIVGAAFVLFRVFAGVFMLSRILRSALPIPPWNPLAGLIADAIPRGNARLRLCLHPDIASPVSFGVRTWWILLPASAEQWDATRVRLVVAHELAHCERRDYLAVLFLRLFSAAGWFHPFTWLGLRQFRALCENAADDRALEETEPSIYARELLRIVSELRQSPPLLAAATLSIGERATIRDRIAAMLDTAKDRRRVPLRASLALSLTVFCAVVVLCGVRLVHAEKPAASSATPVAGEKTPSVATLGFLPVSKEILLTVRDEQGAAVAGAEIKPGGCRTALDPASWFAWNPLVPNESVKTDAAGQATLRIPEYAQEDLVTSGITATVQHPEFCALSAEIPVLSPKDLILKRGAMIVVRSDTPGSEDWRVCADLSRARGGFISVPWRPRDGTNGVQAQVPPGEYAIRAMAIDREGRMYFSEPSRLTALQGASEDLAVAVKPGGVVRGKLSMDVPRPISNGKVMGRIVSRLEGADDLTWPVGATVQADGAFEIKDVPPGALELLAVCDGFVSRNPDGDRLGDNASVTPQVFPQSEAEQVEIAMEKTGTASILVLGPDGLPLRDVTVSFWPNQVIGSTGGILGHRYDQGSLLTWLQHEHARGPSPVKAPPKWQVQTDSAGRAMMPNLPSGTEAYSVTAEGMDMPVKTTSYGAARREGSVVIVRGEVTSLSIQMEAKGKTSLQQTAEMESRRRGNAPDGENVHSSIAARRLTANPFPVTAGEDLVGRVVDESGAPLAGVVVDAWTWAPGCETVTDLEGRFRLKDPQAEKGKGIEVQFSLAGFSPVHVTRQPVGALGQDVILSHRPYFEGVVTDSRGQPVGGQRIRATAGEKETDIATVDYWCETITDNQGHYRFHVFPDTYRLEVRSKSGEVASVVGQVIARDEMKPLDIKLAPGLTFRAEVVDAESGAPVAGVRFSHWRYPGVEGVSDERGQVAISGMFPGDFNFEVEAEKQGYRRWWAQAAKNLWERRQIEDSGWQRNFDNLQFSITAEDSPFRIEMEKGVTIRGIVRSPDGKPVSGATVAPARTGSGNSLTGDSRFSVRSGGDGRFVILLPASNGVFYNLVAHDGDYKQWRGLANGVLPPIATKPGQVIENAELFLTLPCTVRGKVLDETGQAVAGREVRAAPADAWENRYYFPTTRTLADGTFELRHVRFGKNLIQVDPFWLDPKEAPVGTTAEVEAVPDRPVIGVVLTAQPRQ